MAIDKNEISKAVDFVMQGGEIDIPDDQYEAAIREEIARREAGGQPIEQPQRRFAPIKGKNVTLEADESIAGPSSWDKSNWKTDSSNPFSMMDPKSNTGAIASGLAQGLSLGHDDELQGLLSALEGGGYESGRDYRRGMIKTSKTESPYLHGAAEFAGGAALPLGGATKGATLGSKMLNAAAIGAPVGALTGEGVSDSPLLSTETAINTGVGGVAGGVMSPIMAAGAHGAGKLVRSGAEKFSNYLKPPPGAGDEQIARSLNIAPEDITNMSAVDQYERLVQELTGGDVSKRQMAMQMMAQNGMHPPEGVGLADVAGVVRSGAAGAKGNPQEIAKNLEIPRIINQGVQSPAEKVAVEGLHSAAASAPSMSSYTPSPGAIAFTPKNAALQMAWGYLRKKAAESGLKEGIEAPNKWARMRSMLGRVSSGDSSGVEASARLGALVETVEQSEDRDLLDYLYKEMYPEYNALSLAAEKEK